MMHAHAIAPAHAVSMPPMLPMHDRIADEKNEPVLLRHLVTPREIEAVLPLRDGIDLSAHAAAGAAFYELEKKETN
jgi:hypothetical protein